MIRNNTFMNFYANDPATHSEAIYVGYSTNGLIENNTFTNNGNTGHVYFTYFGTASSEGAPASNTYPRNMCVRGNTFNAHPRQHITTSRCTDSCRTQPTSRIYIQSSASVGTDGDNYYGSC